jgi:hypothetical protein
MRFHFIVAAAIALTTPVYARAIGTVLHSRAITDSNRGSDNLSIAFINSRGTAKGTIAQGKTTKVTPAIPGKKSAAGTGHTANGAIAQGKKIKVTPGKNGLAGTGKKVASVNGNKNIDDRFTEGTLIVERAVDNYANAGTELTARSTTWLPVWVAIYTGDSAFKHWALFVEDEEDEKNSFIVHVQGSAGRFRYEARKTNAHNSSKLVKIIQVGHVDSTKKKELRDVAKAIPIKNNDGTWNCQDFVWSLIEKLGEDGLLDVEDETYINGRQEVWDNMEGLV